MSTADYLTQLTRDSRAFAFNSIVPKSQEVYSSMQKAYVSCCEVIGTNLALTYISPTWLAMAKQENIPTSEFRIWALKGFISYCVNDKNGKPIKPSSASNYLSAVRKLLINLGVSVKFMDESSDLSSVRRGAQNEAIGMAGNSLAEKQVIPITIDMVDIATKELLDVNINLIHFALFVFCVMSYHYLCRLCELVRVKGTSHHLLAENVVFVITPVSEGPFKGIPPKNPQYVTADQLWKSVPAISMKQLAGSNAFLKDSKKDPYGEGDRVPHERVINRPSTSIYELSELQFEWAMRAKPETGQPFFSSSTHNFVLSKSQISKWCKDIAKYFGLNPKRVRPHALRYAGASALAAAGLPEYIIKKMGRWKSLAFLRYIRLSIDMFSRCSKILADRAGFSPIRDIRSLLPLI